MAVGIFARIPVKDFRIAVEWYVLFRRRVVA